MKKKKQKGNPNDLRTTVIRQKEPDILSIFIRYSRDLSLQPPFAEVLSGLLRAAYWPLVFTFSGLFWPGPFFPIFRQWIPKRCKGVHCVDLGESLLTRIYLQKSASIQPRMSPSKFGGKFNSLFIRLLGLDPTKQEEIDKMMVETLDGSQNEWGCARAWLSKSIVAGRRSRLPDFPSHPLLSHTKKT